MAKRWYVVQCYSTFEKKVAQAIRETVEKKGLSDQIEELAVPSENFVEVRRGKKVADERSVFPGYVLAKMELTDELWHLVNDVPRVTGFLGSRTQPSPISEAEVARILQAAKDKSADNTKVSSQFEIGEQVRVSEGPFSSFNGTIEELDDTKGRVKVMVSIFGRATPVDLEYSQVERL